MPEWLPEIPGAAARKLPPTSRAGASAVYYPAGVNRIFAGPDQDSLLMELGWATRPVL